VDDHASRIDQEFTALPLRELADAALSQASSLGAQHADFRAERIRGQQISLSDGTPQTLFDADDTGLAVRVIVDGTWGFASAVDLTADAAAQAARQAVEVGTFTGYSSICIARGLAPAGHLLCCDISEEWTSVARKYWEKAGLSDRIELRLGPAIDTLRSLPDEEMFDLAFIDADKGGYLGYWREVVPRVRPGGLIMVDNTFSHGRVIDAGNDNPLVIAVRDFNDHAAADDRVDLVIVPIGDGLTLARKRD